MRSGIFILMLVSSFVFGEGSPESALYYSTKSAFSPSSPWETRLGAGYDFSNPYLNVYGAGLSVFYQKPTSIVGVGLEGTLYTHSTRASAEDLQNQLNRFNYELSPQSPTHSVHAIFRLTPLAGLINFFGSSVVSAEVNLLLRTGIVRYEQLGNQPSVGGGVEFVVGMSPSFGIHSSIFWDMEHVNRTWQARSGLRVGPVVRF